MELAPHTKLSMKTHATLNEAWLQEQIRTNPEILGLGPVRVLDRERSLTGGGRLDLLLWDEDAERRYEVELMLGATDPSHIIRTIEYWDLERRRYPSYEHVAVLVAEQITTRFLNVMQLLSGTIPLIAIQLDALEVCGKLVLNFVRILDQVELRADDIAESAGAKSVDRTYWVDHAGDSLVRICEQTRDLLREASKQQVELNFVNQYIGLKANGVTNNFVHFGPRPYYKLVHAWVKVSDANTWKARLDQAGIQTRARAVNRLEVSLKAGDLEANRATFLELFGQASAEALG